MDDISRALTPDLAPLLLRRGEANLRVEAARYERGVLSVAIAAAKLQEALPTAVQVWFYGAPEPQDPGSTAAITVIVDGAGQILYSADQAIDPEGIEDELSVVADYLTSALDDGIEFLPGGEHRGLLLNLDLS